MKIGRPPWYPNATFSKRISPGPGGNARAPGLSTTSGSVTRIASSRPAAADARDAWATSMPAMRSGQMSMRTYELKATM